MTNQADSARHPYNPDIELAASQESLRTAIELPELGEIKSILADFGDELEQIAALARLGRTDQVCAMMRQQRTMVNLQINHFETLLESRSPTHLASLYAWQQSILRVGRFIFLVLDKHRATSQPATANSES
jgi:hypothetical protein